MLKKLMISTSILFISFSAYSWAGVDKPLLAKQCHELAQKIERLSFNQIDSCANKILDAATSVEETGPYILKEYWFNARTNLHRSYRLLSSTIQLHCKGATEISSTQKGIDLILNQLYGLE